MLPEMRETPMVQDTIRRMQAGDVVELRKKGM